MFFVASRAAGSKDWEDIAVDIRVEHISKSYDELSVLEDFTYRFREGQTTCIMGESGCGKTTLLSIMLGIEQPDSGSVEGVPYGKLGAVFQEDRLCENLSAEANIRLVRKGASNEAEIVRAMEAVRLQDAFHKPVRELSGGMKRRVAVLRALLAEADCIVMDEPLKGMDEETKIVVIEMIKKYTAGKTLIVVTHDKEEPGLFAASDVLEMQCKR